MDYSEQGIRNHCPHCDLKGWAFEFLIEENTYFTVLCDSHPLVEGHLLIIPKRHVSCIGEYTKKEFEEFLTIYRRVEAFIKNVYGSVATFEHGKIGQTVFHSHIHLIPYSGTVAEIIPEGNHHVYPLSSLTHLIDIYEKEGQYLFFSLNGATWTVSSALGAPRFFRDRFAKALNKPERANWKETRQNSALLAQGHAENRQFLQKYAALISN